MSAASNIKKNASDIELKNSLIKAIYDASPDGILFVDADRKVISHNSRFVEIWSIPAEHLCGTVPGTAIGMNDGPLLAKIINQAESPEYYSTRIQALYADPDLIDYCDINLNDGRVLECNTRPIHSSDGEYLGRVWVFHDISQFKQVNKSLQYTQFVSDHAPDSIIWLDEHARIVYANDAACSLYGYSKNEMNSLTIFDMDVDVKVERWPEHWQKLQLQGSMNFETKHRQKGGAILQVEVSANFVQFEGATINVVFIRNISERKEQQKKLEASRTRFETLFDYSSDGQFILDMQGNLIDVNRTAYEGLGYSKAELMGMKVTELDTPEFAAKVPERMKHLMAQGSAVFESAHYRKNGSIMPIEIKARIIELEGEKVVFCVIRDITERKVAEEEIRNLAFFDPLTKLPNRRLLIDRLQQAIVSSMRNGRHGALLFIDLDHFKTLNDTLGHDIGDMLLQQVSLRLKSSVREVDTVARLGGDEFMLILEELSSNIVEAGTQTEEIVEKIIAEVSRFYQLDTYEYRTTPSVGATLFLGNHVKLEELMKQADIAMYQSKKAGRNTLRFFDPEMQRSINDQAMLASDLLKAVEEKQFKLFFQVQVDHRGRATGAEALARWIHPESGIVSSADFIPLAEETGLIHVVGKWVLDTACKVLQKWQQDESTRGLLLAINVSSRQFHKADFASDVKAAVDEYGIDPKLLKLELTESMLLDNIEETILTMNTLNDIGVMLSLDDFGTGYSSLQYLKRLPLDQLKIDQSFVRDIVTDSSDKAIVRTIIAMAESLGLDVIAEGVETVEQRQQLSVMGCNNFQGFLFSKPLNMDAFEALLNSNHAG